ncbi:hypothetical protein EC957_000257 [Mortierella hygrophila]|uniref:Uncharacterized protein n=1 Tax=Mortierella hygrophila TaxID=979708 RepID=A0A9P6FG85_9FUNG|nr:hypothetical protein EC957_000257 [Mortierella hygrophila]
MGYTVMHFKSTIIAALLIGLSLAAPAPVIDLTIGPQAATGETQRVEPSDLSIIGDVIWPVAFSRQCNTLFAITTSLDKQLAHAKSKNKYSCTAAQAAIIAKPASCPPLNIILNVLWPIAFAQQEALTARIAAQTECLGAYQGRFC